jgi:hypothetical protein
VIASSESSTAGSLRALIAVLPWLMQESMFPLGDNSVALGAG